MKRSPGLLLLGVAMAWLAVAGLVNGWFQFTGQQPPLPRYVGPLTALCGIAAGATAAGIFAGRGWALAALRAWMGACVLLAVVLALRFRGFSGGSIPGLFGLAVFTLVLFAALENWVRGQLRDAAGRAPR